MSSFGWGMFVMQHLLTVVRRQGTPTVGKFKIHRMFCVEQHNNPRFVVHSINGYPFVLSLSAWAELTGLRYGTILQRLHNGYSNEQALQSKSLKFGNKNACL